MIRLYGVPRSGNTHKVRMALAFLGLDYEEIAADPAMRREPAYLAMNPLAQVPVLDDDGFMLRDSQAILAYLAAKHRPGEWDGHTAEERGEIGQWLSLAANENANGLAALRAIRLFNLPGNEAQAEAIVAKILPVYETRLGRHQWLAADRMTIADLAASAYPALAGDARIDLAEWPGISRWIAEISAIDGFPEMPGWLRAGAR